MKSVLVLLLSILCYGAKAQTALLNIKNNTPCQLIVNDMLAIDPANGNVCVDLISNTFGLGAFSGFSNAPSLICPFPPGWSFIANPEPFCATTTFQWVQIDFTLFCPSCPPETGSMGDLAASCTSPGTTWLGPCSGRVGSWTPKIGVAMSDVFIDFH